MYMFQESHTLLSTFIHESVNFPDRHSPVAETLEKSAVTYAYGFVTFKFIINWVSHLHAACAVKQFFLIIIVLFIDVKQLFL